MQSRRAMWLVLLAAAGCAPHGRIDTPHGSDRLRAAWHMNPTDQRGVRLLLLSNSHMPCDPDESDDPAERARAWQQLEDARNREGSVVVGLALRTVGSVEGDYPLADTIEVLDQVEPRASHALARHVEEAALSYDGAFDRRHQPTSGWQEYPVSAPGEVTLTRALEETLEGTFSLDTVYISGAFRTQACHGVAFDYMGLSSDFSNPEPVR